MLVISVAGACSRPAAQAPEPAPAATAREPERAPPGFAPLSPDERLAERLLVPHLEELATKIGVRNAEAPWELASASDYVVDQFEASGYAVVRHGFELGGSAMQNLEVALRGGDLGDEVIVVGAHYDSPPQSRGADDNATGVAVLLTLAQLFRDTEPRRAVRFVAFAAGAPPYSGTEDAGSLRYARVLARDNVQVLAMLSLDSLGVYSTLPGSQGGVLDFKPPLPSRGDFVAVIGNAASLPLAQSVASAFDPEQGLSAKATMPAGEDPRLDSDHSAFHRLDVPAVLVTDLRELRPQQASDAIESVDVERLARVVDRLAEAIDTLANPDKRSIRPAAVSG